MKVLFLNILAFFAISSKDFTGKWNVSKDNTTIEIFEKDGNLFGKIVSSDNEKAKKGTLILRDFKYSNGKWTGKLYAIKTDKLVDAEMQINNGTLEITAQIGFISKTIIWEKVTP